MSCCEMRSVLCAAPISATAVVRRLVADVPSRPTAMIRVVPMPEPPPEWARQGRARIRRARCGRDP